MNKAEEADEAEKVGGPPSVSERAAVGEDRGTPVTREALYDEVWAEPMTTVAARYRVSGSFLARVCARLNVPRPPRGYWARLEYGKAGNRPALPEARPQDELAWSRDGKPVRMPRPLPKPPERTKRPRIRPAASRPSLHPLLRGAREHFDAAREPDDGYLRPSKKLLVDLVVSKSALASALETANELYLALEDRGHSVGFAPPHQRLRRLEVDVREQGGPIRNYPTFWSPWRPTVVLIGTVAVGLTLFEMSEEVEVQYRNGKYIPVSEVESAPRRQYAAASSWTTKRDLPSGRLCVQAYAPYTRANWVRHWRESKRGDLHTKFKSIARALEEAAPTIATQFEEGERQAALERQQWEASERQWRREEKERRRAEAIKESREELSEIIESWAEAKRVEAFFEDAQRRAAELDDRDSNAVLDRLKLARDLLGSVDALRRFRSWKAPEER